MPLYNPITPVYTWAGKPASLPAGQVAFISDAGARGSHWRYDTANSRWRPLGGAVVLASLTSTTADHSATDTVVFQYQMPAGLWQQGDVLRFDLGAKKSGTTDTMAINLRVGVAGTTADTSVGSLTFITASQRQAAAIVDTRLEAATSVQRLPVTAGTFGYSGTGNSTAFPAAVGISSTVANALYVSVSIASSSSTDTVALVGSKLTLIS